MVSSPAQDVVSAANDGSRQLQYSLDGALLALRRQKWLIIFLAALGLAAGGATVIWLPRSYSASASIVLDPRRPRVTDLPSIISEQTTLDITPQLRSEVQILESDELCRRVIQQLDLLRQPPFKVSSSQSLILINAARQWLLDNASWLRPIFAIERSNEPAGAATQAENPNEVIAYAVAAYKSHLTVSSDGRSYVIYLQFTSHDPALAARIINRHIDLYLADQVAYKREVAKRASEWLSEEIPELQSRLRASQEEAQQFREQNNIIMTGGTSLLTQQLAAVNAQLPAAVLEHISAETKLKRVHELLRRGTVDSEAAILGSQTIERLREQEATLITKMGELSAVYGTRHPSVIKANEELNELRRAISAEEQRIANNLENDVAVTGRKEAELRDRLADLKRQSVVADRAEAKLRDLEREVGANQALLDTLTTRYKQVSAQEGAQVPDARIVSLAGTPIEPSFPKPRIALPAGLSVGLLLGMVAAFCREFTARGFHGSHEVEAEFALPILGSLPIVPGNRLRHTRPEDYVIEHPRSVFAEAIRNVRNSIQAVPYDVDTPRTFLITSSLSGEGKSVIAVSLARSFARSGKRTLLIDCDLRHPSIGHLLGVAEISHDLATLISEGGALEDIVCRDQKSELDFIGARMAAFEPQDILSSCRTGEILRYCAERYEIIIIDSPPITAVSDPLIVARRADATILAVRWGQTPREIAKASLNKLFLNGARLCGAVLTQVDIQKGIFSPNEPEYYHKLNRPYYVDTLLKGPRKA